MQPRAQAYREAGWNDRSDVSAYSHACRIERRPGVRDRIAYLSRQAEEMIAVKRERIEAQLWAIADGNIADFFEIHEVVQRDHTGQPMTEPKCNEITGEMETALSHEKRVRPKLLTDLPPHLAKLIEEVRVDNHGRLIPKLYSKHQANKELRAMLNLGTKSDASDVSKLSDQELISTLAQQAKELGIDIKLDYTFHLPKKDEGDGG